MKRPTDPEEQRAAVFKTRMNEIAAAFRIDPSKEMLGAYWHALSDLDCDRLNEGFDGVLKHEEFWPTPARIRKYVHPIPEDYYPELD